MALSAKVVQFRSGTASANLGVTGVGFLPKVVMLFASGQNSTGQGAPADMCIGFTNGVATRSILHTHRDNVASWTNKTYMSSSSLLTISQTGTGTLDNALTYVSFDSDGFTISRAGGSIDATINALCLGGTDLTNTYVGSFTSAASGSGSVTGVGFQPDAVIFLYPTASFTTQDSFVSNTGWGFGVTSGVGESFSLFTSGITSTATSMIRSNAMVTMPNSSAVTERFNLQLSSFDSDGFSYTRNLNITSVGTIYFLALKGGNYKAGTFQTRTDANNISVTGVGFQPSGIITLSSLLSTVTQTTESTNVSAIFGAATGATERGCAGMYALSASNPSDTQHRQDSGAILAGLDMTSSWNVRTQVDFSAFTSDGFTLAMDDADTATNLAGYLAFGGSSGAGGGPIPGNVRIIRAP